MATIANLAINFSTNMAAVVTDFEKTQKAVRNASNAITESLAVLKTAFEAVIGVEAIKMGGEFISQRMDIIAQNERMAQSFAVTTQALAANAQVARESGTDIQSLAGDWTKMEKTLSDAAQGGKKGADALHAIGLNVKDLINLAPDQQFAKIAAAIDKIENPTQRMGAELKIFGKNSREVLNVIDDYPAKLAEATAFTEKFGLAVNEFSSNQVIQAKNAVDKVGEAAAGIGNTIAVHLAPMIEGLAKSWLGAADGADIWGKRTDAAIAFIINDLDAMELVLKGIKDGWLSFATIVDSGWKATGAMVTGQGELAKSILDQGHNQVARIGQDYLNAANSVGTFGTAVKKYYADSAAEAAKATSKPKSGAYNDLLNPNTEALDAAIKTADKWLLKQGEEVKTLQQETQYVGMSTIQITKMKDARKFDTEEIEKQIGLTGPALAAFHARAAAIREERQEALQAAYDAQRTFGAGAADFFAKYNEDATNAAANTKKVFEDAFKGGEDAAVEFSNTGKLSIASLLQTVKDDITRMSYRSAMASMFGTMPTASGGGSGIMGMIGSVFGMADAGGGGNGIIWDTPAVPGFASGGSFDVGGTGGMDTNMLSLNGRPVAKVSRGETVSVSPDGGGNSGGGNTYVTMNIQTPDANSFNYSMPQTMQKLQTHLSRAAMRNG